MIEQLRETCRRLLQEGTVQVVIGYNYKPLVPIPWFQGAGLTTTSAETQLVLEQG